MSIKSTPAKLKQDLAKNPQALAHPSHVPAVQEPFRDVTKSLAQLPANQNQNNVIATYKDLIKPIHDQIAFQKKQFLFAVAFIVLATTLLLAYHQVTKPRAIASTFNGFVTDATPTHTEHYQYDKSCYEGEKGEQICMERTSQKR
ncbi:MAG: hypothetical protein H7256_15555 [Bdellovibrio sp.]|nr:hypothetical protein [Bdellovibrio sp.]